MRVYVSCHHPGPANQLAAALEAAGHQVISSWHRSADPRPSSPQEWAASAGCNLLQIDSADVFALIASAGHLDGSARVAGGKFFEAGYAAARMLAGSSPQLVYTVGGVENGMLHHPGILHVADAAELVARLAARQTPPTRKDGRR